MLFRLPVPRHGWRAFWGEVGIIVLGVLTALVAQQVVEGLSQRSQARAAERAIREEIEINFARLRERSSVKPCVDRRLDEIQALIGSAGANQSIRTPQ